MIVIYCLENNGFFCEKISIKGYQQLTDKYCTRVLLSQSLHLKITKKRLLVGKLLFVYCEMIPQKTDLEFDICNKNYYFKMGENVRPIYVKNSHGDR